MSFYVKPLDEAVHRRAEVGELRIYLALEAIVANKQ
jgi:hypothetical protein